MVLSSERYCWANKDNARTIVAELGRDRVHVVITLRPLDRILPSQWQMSVQGGLTSTYEQWLRASSLDEDSPGGRKEAQRFWRRHAHGRLVRRWAAAAGGGDKVTVIVVDDKDRSMLPGAFAALLDLPPGLLVPIAAKSNRSLTAGEAELVRNDQRAVRRRRVVASRARTLRAARRLGQAAQQGPRARRTPDRNPAVGG